MAAGDRNAKVVVKVVIDPTSKEQVLKDAEQLKQALAGAMQSAVSGTGGNKPLDGLKSDSSAAVDAVEKIGTALTQVTTAADSLKQSVTEVSGALKSMPSDVMKGIQQQLVATADAFTKVVEAKANAMNNIKGKGTGSAGGGGKKAAEELAFDETSIQAIIANAAKVKQAVITSFEGAKPSINSMISLQDQLRIAMARLDTEVDEEATAWLQLKTIYDEVGIEIEKALNDPAMAAERSHGRLVKMLGSEGYTIQTLIKEYDQLQKKIEALRNMPQTPEVKGALKQYRDDAALLNEKAQDRFARTLSIKEVISAQDLLVESDKRIAIQEEKWALVEADAAAKARFYRQEVERLVEAKAALRAQDATADTTVLDQRMSGLSSLAKAPPVVKAGGQTTDFTKVFMWAIQWHLIYGAIRKIEEAFGEMVKEAIEFDKQMRHVNTIAKLNDEQFQAMKKTMLDLSTLASFGFESGSEVSKGLYFVESAGITDTKEALDVLTNGAQLATGTMAELEDTLKGVISLINIYGKENMTAQKASDLMYATVEAAVPDMKEFANAQADLMVAAAVSKVEFRELGAAYATLTREGFSAQRAGTGVKNVIMTLVKPSDELRQTMRGMGYESGQAMLQELGLAKTLMLLYNAVNGNNDEFVRLLGNIRSAGAAMGIVAEQGSVMKESMTQIDKTMSKAGASSRAMSEQMRTLGSGWKNLLSQMRAAVQDNSGPIYKFFNALDNVSNQAANRMGVQRLGSAFSNAIKTNSKVGEMDFEGWKGNKWVEAIELSKKWEPGSKQYNNAAKHDPALIGLGVVISRMYDDAAYRENVGTELYMALGKLGMSAGKQKQLAGAVVPVGWNPDEATETLADAQNDGSEPTKNTAWFNRMKGIALENEQKLAQQIEWYKGMAQEKGLNFEEAYGTTIANEIDRMMMELIQLGAGGSKLTYQSGTDKNGKPIFSTSATPFLFNGKGYGEQWKYYNGVGSKGQAASEGVASAEQAYINTRDNMYRSLERFAQTTNSEVEPATDMWTKYQDKMKAITASHSKMATSFDSNIKGVQKTLADWLTALEQAPATIKQISDAEASLSAEKERNKTFREQAAALKENMELQAAYVNSVNSAFEAKPNKSVADKAAHEAFLKESTAYMSGNEKQFSLFADLIAKSDRNIKGYTDRISDMRTNLVGLGDDLQRANELLAQQQVEADKYFNSQYDNDMAGVKTLEGLRDAVKDAFLSASPDQWAIGSKILDAIDKQIEGRTAQAESARLGRNTSFQQLLESMVPTPTARDIMEDETLFNRFIEGRQKSFDALTKQIDDLRAKKEANPDNEDLLPQLKALEKDRMDMGAKNITDSIAAIGAIAEDNLPLALKLWVDMERKVREYPTELQGPIKAQLVNARNELFGVEKDYARKMNEIDESLITDREKAMQRYAYTKDLLPGLKSGSRLSRQAYGTMFDSAASMLSTDIGYANGDKFAKDDKAGRATALLNQMYGYMEAIQKDPRLQIEAANALAGIFGSKEAAEQFLTKFQKDNPMKEALVQAVQVGMNLSPEVASKLVEVFDSASKAIRDSFVDAFMAIGTEGKSLADTLNNMFNSLAKMAFQYLAQTFVNTQMDNLLSKVPGLVTKADGGYISGSFQAFAVGGVATRPTLGLIAEAGKPEAVVPLPNGRHIPVQMMGGSKAQEVQTTTVVVFDRNQLAALRTGKNEIVNYVVADLKANGPIRQSLKRTLR